MDGQALKEREALYEWAGRASKQEFLEQVVYNHPLVREWLQKGLPKVYVDAFIHPLYKELEGDYNFFSLTFLGKREEVNRKMLDVLYTYQYVFKRADQLSKEPLEGLSKALEELATPYERDGGFANLVKAGRGMDCDKLSLLATLYLRSKGVEADPMAFSVSTPKGLVAHAVVVYKNEKGKYTMVDFSNLHAAYAGTVGEERREGNKEIWENKQYRELFTLEQKGLEDLHDFLARALSYETALFLAPPTSTKQYILSLAEKYAVDLREFYKINPVSDTVLARKGPKGTFRKIYAFAYGDNLAELMSKGVVI